MRTGATLFHYSQMTTTQSTTTAKATFSPPAAATTTLYHSSPWHSPIPYLFGGIAAMLGLIAFALLILACSYWKLSGQVNGGEGDVESGGATEKGENNSDTKSLPIFEEKFLVIMAGEVKPTYMATPMIMSSSKASNSFNDDEKVDSYNKEEDSIVIKEKDETREQNGGGEESQMSQEQSNEN